MRKLVRINKSLLCFVLSFVIVGTFIAIPYQEAKAEAIVAGTIGVTGGVALLSLASLCGVGMELDNNRRFNELSDSEKERIQNGLATNFDDVALQRGAAIEDIHKWVNDLGNGVLDKASECWGIFKDWVKNITLKDGAFETPALGSGINPSVLNGFSFVNSRGKQCVVDSTIIDKIEEGYKNDTITAIVVDSLGTSSNDYTIYVSSSVPSNNEFKFNNDYSTISCTAYNGNGNIYPMSTLSYGRIKQYGVGIYSSYPFVNSSGENINGMGFDGTIYFSTNTDYLERLKGENEDVIDVIDVTDAKNPIVESRPNNLTRIDYNRGGKRPTPDDDDDKVIMGGLVPTNIYYDALDDYNEGLKNEVVIYDNKINENPEDEGKVFVSPAPIVNVNNFFNTLPCVNVPATNTVVNNNYTYNNYNNNNTTIYELPYNSDLIPYLPTMLFENKFPFCIPFDIYTLFSVFYVEREAPEFTFDVPFPSEYGLEVKQITLGLKDYEYCALVLRIMWYFLFLLGLMLISRKLIKG